MKGSNVSTNLNGANLVLACQRSDCDQEVVVGLGWVNVDSPGVFAGTVASSLVSEFTEIGSDDTTEEWDEIDGWGFDVLEDGLNTVLHCPVHRL